MKWKSKARGYPRGNCRKPGIPDPAGFIGFGLSKIPTTQTTLPYSQDRTEAAGIHTSGSGGCFPHGAPVSTGFGPTGLAGPKPGFSYRCACSSANWEVGQHGLPSYWLHRSLYLAPPAWASFILNEGRSRAAPGFWWWHAPSLWPFDWVGFTS
jgi:hypothetical protein